MLQCYGKPQQSENGSHLLNDTMEQSIQRGTSIAEFSSYEPEGVGVLGEVIESFVLAFPENVRDFGLAALEKHGICDVYPNGY